MPDQQEHREENKINDGEIISCCCSHVDTVSEETNVRSELQLTVKNHSSFKLWLFDLNGLKPNIFN